MNNNINFGIFNNLYKKIYIATKKNVTYDEYNNEVVDYNKPFYLGKFNYQPLTGDELQAYLSAYGETKNKLKCIELLMKHYNCGFDEAREVMDFILDGKPLPNPDLTPQQIAQANAQAQELLNKPKCPTCGSTNIKKMGGIERGASIAAFGIFSKKINKTFKCNNCGYTW